MRGRSQSFALSALRRTLHKYPKLFVRQGTGCTHMEYDLNVLSILEPMKFVGISRLNKMRDMADSFIGIQSAKGTKVSELVVLKAHRGAGNFFIDVLAKQSPILRFDHEHLKLVINVWSPRATELRE